VSDVTTKIQIWNESNSEHVGGTACDPIPSEGVTCHTDHWKGVSSIHVIIIYIILLKYFGIAYHKLEFWFSHSFGRNWIARGTTYIFTVGRIPYLYFSCNIRQNQLELKSIVLVALLR
jgi:hypothetical protein